METIHAEQYALADAQEIEKQLVQLWREVGSAEKPVVRARVLTLLLAAREEAEARMAERLMQLAERHPARNLLLLVGDNNEQDHFDAAATLLCSMRGRSVCAEQVRLHASGPALQRLPSAVRSLLTPDLPVVLWWDLAPATHLELLAELRVVADWIIFDSSSCDPTSLDTVPDLWQGEAVSDLNWQRLNPWRELVADFFDLPERCAELAQIQHVVVRTGHSGMAGWLMAGWLASRLGWQVQSARATLITLQKPGGGTVTLEVAQEEGEREIHNVRLDSADSSFDITHEGTHVRCRVTGNTGDSQRVIPLEQPGLAALVSRELDYLRPDPLYQAALHIVEQALENMHDGHEGQTDHAGQ